MSFGMTNHRVHVTVELRESNGVATGEIELDDGLELGVRKRFGSRWRKLAGKSPIRISWMDGAPRVEIDNRRVRAHAVSSGYGRTGVTLIDDPYRPPFGSHPDNEADLLLMFAMEEPFPAGHLQGVYPTDAVVIEARVLRVANVAITKRPQTVEDCYQNPNPPPPPDPRSPRNDSKLGIYFGLGKAQLLNTPHESGNGRLAIRLESGASYVLAAEPSNYLLVSGGAEAASQYMIHVEGIATQAPVARLKRNVGGKWEQVTVEVEGEKVEVRPKILARTTTGFQTTNLTTFVDDEGGDVVVRALLCDWKPQSPHSDVNGCLFQFTKVSAGSTQQSRSRQLRIAGEPARLDPAARASRRR